VTDPASGEGALAGIRVVDLTRARAGPTCVRQLADFGADVVQVVDPAAGDIGGSDSANLHRNKRSIALDLKSPEGLDAFLALIDRTDVFVENLRPRVKLRLGIGPAVLLERNPRLVYASLSGFGQDGPYAERGGLDQVAQGMGGVMSVTGPPGTGPWRVGIAISDTASGTFLTQGVLAALFSRERTGRGQWVHTSLLEAMVNLMDFQACRWLTDGEVPPQQGNDHPTFFPMGTYRCADGYVNIAGLKHLQEFLDAIGAGGLLDNGRFATDESRKANRSEFNAACEARLAELTMTEVVERLNALDIPAGPVYALDQVFADPQVQHLGLYETRPGIDGEPVALLRHPVTLADTPAAVGSGPPRSGAHTRPVLREVGYSDEEIDALLASGAASDRADAPGWLT
jgi:crotonobetainyl-CoA:carnitine CoA-transferase CaiB-like acyl-CoA transferase